MSDISLEKGRTDKFVTYANDANPVVSVLPAVISDSGRLDKLLCSVLKLVAKRKAFGCPHDKSLKEWRDTVSTLPSVEQAADAPDAPASFDLRDAGLGQHVPNFVSHSHQINLFRKAAFMYSEACARIVAELHIQQSLIYSAKASDAAQRLSPEFDRPNALRVSAVDSSPSCVEDSCSTLINASYEALPSHNASLRARNAASSQGDC